MVSIRVWVVQYVPDYSLVPPPVYGARPLKRAIQVQLKNPLAKLILEGKFAAKDTIKVDCKGGVMKFDK